MVTDSVYNIYRQLEEDNLSFLYSGAFSDDITEWVVDLSSQNISGHEGLAKLERRVSFLMVECLQNVVRHGNDVDEKVTPIRPNLFMTRNIGDAYFITSANLISNEAVDGLQEQLENINQLDKDALKKLYREALSSGELNEKGGGGLGLIEMARKSGQKIDFHFGDWNDDYSHFFFRLKLAAQGIVPANFDGPRALTPAQSFLRMMDADDLLMVFRGDFSKDFLIPILNVMENHMRAATEDKDYRRVIKVLIELLQNISKHGHASEGSRDGIFMLGNEGRKHTLFFGNYTSKEDAKRLVDKVEQLNAMDMETRKAHYRQTLKEGEVTDRHGAGLGLIEAARNTQQDIVVSIHEEAAEPCFVALKIVV